jgi:hypothetical protein
MIGDWTINNHQSIDLQSTIINPEAIINLSIYRSSINNQHFIDLWIFNQQSSIINPWRHHAKEKTSSR